MSNKTIIAGLVILAFVAGSIMTGAMAYAAPNGQPFQALWDAIDDLQGQIDDIELTPGPQGATGPTGATGTTGATSIDVLTITGTESSGSNGLFTSTADCPSTHTLIGGGFAKMRDKDYTTSGERVWTSSQLDADTWQVTVDVDSGINANVQAQAFCIKLIP